MSQSAANLTLTQSQFDAIASGVSDVESVQILRSGQKNKWLMTLNSIMQSVGHERMANAFELLLTVLKRNPVVFDQTVTYPYVLLWAQICLERVMGVSPVRSFASTDFHIDHFNAIAVVAAHRAGIEGYELSLPLHNGTVVLPGLGMATFETPSETEKDVAHRVLARSSKDGRIELAYEDQVVVVPKPSPETARSWRPITTFEFTHKDKTFSVAFDDFDPYRNEYQSIADAEKPLSRDQIASWKGDLAAAWNMLVDDFPQHAGRIAEGIQVITPLLPFPHTQHRSHNTAPGGFGAIGTTPSDQPTWLTFAFLDSYRRAEFRALHDLFPLHHATDEDAQQYVPSANTPKTRRDLHENFAVHVTAIEFWGAQLNSTSASKLEFCDAETQFARWRGRVRYLHQLLVEGDDLTELGVRVLNQIESKMEEFWYPVKLSEKTTALAEQVELDFRLCWRLKNVVPNEQQVIRFANASAAAFPCPEDQQLELFITPFGTHGNGHVLRERLGIAKLADEPRDEPNATSGDLYLTDGNYEAATAAYSNAILTNPHDPEPWVGLALAYSKQHDSASYTLLRCPELAYAVHRQLWMSHHRLADPIHIAAWLAPLLQRHPIPEPRISQNYD